MKNFLHNLVNVRFKNVSSQSGESDPAAGLVETRSEQVNDDLSSDRGADSGTDLPAAASTQRRVIVTHITDIRPHPNAHSLDLAEVDGHQVVTGRHYTEGQLGVYFPERSIIPDALAEEMWLKGKLDGPEKNVVKARPLRGIMSDGLFYGLGLDGSLDKLNLKEGQDMTEQLGITFYDGPLYEGEP